MKIISKKEAIKEGFKHYFTGKNCKRGHVSVRYTIGSHCVECSLLVTAEHYKHYKPFKRLYEKSDSYKATKKAINAKRRAIKKNAIPKWANIDKIKTIYLNCPEGHHVDHIIPLQNELVCGLHVENNLQYLTATENIVKSNSFSVEVL